MIRRIFVLYGFSLILAGVAAAQSAVRIEAPKGGFGWLTHPYQTRYVPPINLSNTTRIESLLRAGNLYLSAKDVVALAIENNIDVEVQRYGPLLAREILRRAQSGALLRNVGQGVAQGPTSVSLTGVNVNGTGGLSASAAGSGVSAGGGILTQLGPTVPSLDPVITGLAQFQHITTPLSNTFLTGTNDLITNGRSYQAQYQQNWVWGTSATLTYASSYTKLNSFFYTLNPSTSGDIDLQVTQNLLNGFGASVNGRNIRVQKNNVKATDLQFKQQLIATITAALNLYWDLVSFNQEVASRQEEVRTAQDLFDNNRKQVDIGTLAEIEVTRAESQLYTSKQDLLVAQTNLLQQETVVKNYLSRNGVATSDLAEVHIVPLDKIVIPPSDNIRPVEELVHDAQGHRVEIDQGAINVESKQLDLVGTKSSLKPTLQAFMELTNNGLTGTVTPTGAAQAAAGAPGVGYLGGGYDNLLGQIFRRNFPSYSAGISLNIPLRNRAAQADYVTSVIEIRQLELNLQKSKNQVRVDVQNAVIGLEQARARYDAGVKARVLAAQTLDADQKRFNLGATTAFQVVQDQRDLSSAESTEVQSMANYSHARIAFDQAMGSTLETNGVSVAEAMQGRVSAAPSTIPQ